MKHIVLLIFSFLIIHGASAQNFAWAQHWGNTGYDNSSNITADAGGNVYVCGNFANTVDFDPGPGTFQLTSAGDADGYIAKFNSQGHLLWAKSIGNELPGNTENLKIGSDGYLYVGGDFQGTVDFDLGPGTLPVTCEGFAAYYVAKYDTSGSVAWVKHVVCSGGTFILDENNNIILSGRFHWNTDFDPGPGTYYMSTPTAQLDGFLCKWETNGDLAWAKQFKHAMADFVTTAIDLDNDGNLYVTSTIDSICDIDPDTGVTLLTPFAEEEIFVAKFDTTGGLVWAKQLRGSLPYNRPYGIQVDDAGNVYSCGVFTGTTDFDPGPGNDFRIIIGQAGDAYLHKLDTDGNYIGTAVFASQQAEIGQGLLLGQDGNLYMTGIFQQTVDFDPGPGSAELTAPSGSNIFVLSLDTAIQYRWATQIESMPWGFSIPSAITLDNTGNLYVAGIFANNADFDGGPAVWNLQSYGTEGTDDAFLVKYSSCQPGFSQLADTGCAGSYTWAFNQGTYYDSGRYHYTQADSNGCDTSVTLDLYVPLLYNVITESQGVFTANLNQPFDSYQWFNCDFGTAITGAVNPVFLPSVGGSYALIAGLDGCTDTSTCVLLPLDIDESQALDTYLYPNPTDDFIYLKTSQQGILSLSITDINGKMVYQTSQYQPGQALSTKDWSSGIYLVKVNDGNKRGYYRIVKN